MSTPKPRVRNYIYVIIFKTYIYLTYMNILYIIVYVYRMYARLT